MTTGVLWQQIGQGVNPYDWRPQNCARRPVPPDVIRGPVLLVCCAALADRRRVWINPRA